MRRRRKIATSRPDFSRVKMSNGALHAPSRRRLTGGGGAAKAYAPRWLPRDRRTPSSRVARRIALLHMLPPERDLEVRPHRPARRPQAAAAVLCAWRLLRLAWVLGPLISPAVVSPGALATAAHALLAPGTRTSTGGREHCSSPDSMTTRPSVVALAEQLGSPPVLDRPPRWAPLTIETSARDAPCARQPLCLAPVHSGRPRADCRALCLRFELAPYLVGAWQRLDAPHHNGGRRIGMLRALYAPATTTRTAGQSPQPHVSPRRGPPRAILGPDAAAGYDRRPGGDEDHAASCIAGGKAIDIAIPAARRGRLRSLRLRGLRRIVPDSRTR